MRTEQGGKGLHSNLIQILKVETRQDILRVTARVTNCRSQRKLKIAPAKLYSLLSFRENGQKKMTVQDINIFRLCIRILDNIYIASRSGNGKTLIRLEKKDNLCSTQFSVVLYNITNTFLTPTLSLLFSTASSKS